MDSQRSGINATLNSAKTHSIKKIRYISEDHAVYVEIKLNAKMITKRSVEFKFNQDDITKAALYLNLSQGEIKLKAFENIIGIDFDFVKTDSGYNLGLEWATFGDDYGYQMYNTNKKIILHIPMGSSTFKNLHIDYLAFPERFERPTISLNIIEANINIINSNDPQNQWLKNNYEILFADNKTINIEAVTREPLEHLEY